MDDWTGGNYELRITNWDGREPVRASDRAKKTGDGPAAESLLRAAKCQLKLCIVLEVDIAISIQIRSSQK